MTGWSGVGFKLLSTPPSIGINIHIIGLNTFIIDINIGEKHDRNQLFGNSLRLTDMRSTSDFRKKRWDFVPTRPASQEGFRLPKLRKLMFISYFRLYPSNRFFNIQYFYYWKCWDVNHGGRSYRLERPIGLFFPPEKPSYHPHNKEILQIKSLYFLSHSLTY